MNGLYHPFMQALGFAVLHSLWQGALVFCLLKMILAFVPQRRAVVRYRLAYLCLGALFFLFALTLGMEWQQAGALTPAASAAGAAHEETGWKDMLLLRAAAWCTSYTPMLAWMYAAGVLLFSAKMVTELLQLRLLRRDTTLPGPALQQQFARLRELAGLGSAVALRLSSRIDVPAMLGHLKPVVLLPASLATRLDAQQLEAILLHELAHIRRHDYLWNMLQMVMEILLFFNPAAWWLSSVVRREREHCCDDFVVQHTASVPYAYALLALEEHRQALARPLVAANGNRSSSLFNRIKRITAMKSVKNNSQRTLAAITALVLIAAMACFATAFGQDKKENTKSVTRSYGKSVVIVKDKNGHTQKYEKEYGDKKAVDEAMKSMPVAMEMTDKVLKDMDWDNLDKVVENSLVLADKAMNEVDWNKIQADVDKAMKKAGASARTAADQEEIFETVRKAMDEARNAIQAIDWVAVNKEVNTEVARAMKEVREEMNSTDWQAEVRQSLAEAKEEMRKAREEMRADMEKARQEMKRAREEMKKSQQDSEAGDDENAVIR